jgi:hypothetical protein
MVVGAANVLEAGRKSGRADQHKPKADACGGLAKRVHRGASKIAELTPPRSIASR